MPTPDRPDHRIPDERSIARYVATVPELAARLGGGPAAWDVREIGDGNVNYVFAVRGPAGALCVKQAPPYVRAVGESWPLSPTRSGFEFRALREHARCAPAYLPAPLHYAPELHLLAVEFLDDHCVVRHLLNAGGSRAGFGADMGDYLARTLFGTSDLALPAADKRRLVGEFEANIEMCRIMEEMIFTEIYRPFHRNRWTSPELDPDVRRLRSDTALVIAAARLKNRYLTRREALLHGDLHTGSIMVGPGSTRVIDQEFACFGPMGFDIGSLLAHLLVNYLAQDGRHADGHAEAGTEETPQQHWLLETVAELWHTFVRRFLELWRTSAHGDAYPATLFPAGADDEDDVLYAERSAYLDRIFRDTVGFCGAETIRRVVGFARPADFTDIEDAGRRADAERRALRLGRALLVDTAAHTCVEDIVKTTRRIRDETPPD
ncbi:S-methyl-5-thioribose kinase [Embleya sp. NPDC008237]|uniref:S-methyl-5-thioribose kinase n=1 Tax=Embleya sp. NPDC008237 TaxID=3363978 RepID=UPI0036DFF524